jgi:glycosyltransferase involved in cell wall biosynthesis
MIAEGSYPYVLGGVSSWINNLIRSCPEHEFIILAITPDASEKGKYKYTLPDNVVEVHDIFLNGIDLYSGKKGKRLKLSKADTRVLYDLIAGRDVNWSHIFELFSSKKLSNVNEFFMSRNFFEIVRDLYRTEYPFTPFTDFLWTMRTMYLSFFYILLSPMPKADIYHTVATGYSGLVGSYAKYIHNKPLLLSEHGIYTREREEEIIKADWVKSYYKDLWIKYFYGFSNCTYEFADVVTTLFEKNKHLQMEVGCPEEKLRIIPNGVKLERFKDLEQKENKDVYNVGAVIRVVPIKDIKTMIQAFKLVKDQLENAHFYIMGPTDEDEEYFKECQDLIEFLGVKDCQLTGTIQVTEYIGKMDVMVLTSISEGQPLSIMEGMAAKKPHVTTNVGDCRGLIFGASDDDLGQCGFVEGIMSSEQIASRLIQLAKNEKLRLEFGEIGYKRVKRYYQAHVFIDAFKGIYEELGSD